MPWPIGESPKTDHRTKISKAKKGKPQPERTPEERKAINQKISDGMKRAHKRRKEEGS